MLNREDIDPHIKALIHYRQRVTDDPLRLSVLAAHALIEEMIELAIAEAVPNSECFEVPKMPFSRKLKVLRSLEKASEAPEPEGHELVWKYIEKLTDLRNAAAHKDYETKREELFTDMAKVFYADPAFQTARDRETLLEESTEICAGYLMGRGDQFRRLRQGSQEAKDV